MLPTSMIGRCSSRTTRPISCRDSQFTILELILPCLTCKASRSNHRVTSQQIKAFDGLFNPSTMRCLAHAQPVPFSISHMTLEMKSTVPGVTSTSLKVDSCQISTNRLDLSSIQRLILLHKLQTSTILEPSVLAVQDTVLEPRNVHRSLYRST